MDAREVLQRESLQLGHTAPDFTASSFLRRMLERSSDQVLAMDARCHRVYSSPSFDAMVGRDGRLPLHTAAPPPYVPLDQHPAYVRLLHAVPHVLAGAETASGSLVLLGGVHDRFCVDVTVGAVALPRAGSLAVWLIRPRTAADGDGPANSSANPLSSAPWRTPGGPRPESALTRREGEVLDLLLDGWRVQSIATALFISQHTVRNHLKAIFRKLDAHSQKDLIERVRSRQSRV